MVVRCYCLVAAGGGARGHAKSCKWGEGGFGW